MMQKHFAIVVIGTVILGFAAILKAQNVGSEVEISDLARNGYWAPLFEKQKLEFKFDLPTDLESYHGITSTEIADFTNQAILEVLEHPPVGIEKLTQEKVQKFERVNIILSYSQSTTQNGRLAHEIFRAGSQALKTAQTDHIMALTVVSLDLVTNLFTIEVVVYLDKVFAPVPNDIKLKLLNDVPDAPLLWGFHELIATLAHELYGHVIPALVDIKKNTEGSVHGNEIHSMRQELQFLKEVHDDHGFRISDRFLLIRSTSKANADASCYINGVIVNRKRKLLKKWED